jgi:hypothetical protein
MIVKCELSASRLDAQTGRQTNPVDTENPIRPMHACTYEICSLILLADFAYPDFVILLLVYGPLPFSPYTCTLIPCPSCGADGGNPLSSSENAYRFSE